MTLACTTGAFYVGAVHRTNQKSYANQIAPEEGSQRANRRPLLPTDSSLGSDLSVYLQPELRVSSRTAGSSARWVSADLRMRMRNKNSRRNYVRTPRVVTVVNIRRKGVDQKNRKKAPRFSAVVNWSSRIYRMAKVEQKKSETNPVTDSRVNQNSSCPVDHPSSDSTAVQRFSVVKSKPGRVDHPDHSSGEVTQ